MRKLKKYKPTPFKAKDSTYSKEAADYAVGFIECLCHTKGTWAGKPFELIDWQEQIIRDVFGTLKPNGYRQFNTAYIEIPKKMGKLELAAAVALLLTCGDGEERAEVYGCAADRQQASIVFEVAADMVKMCPALSKRVKILASQKRIIYQPTKKGCVPSALTQNVKDLLASREIENILDNTDFLVLLSQAQSDRAIIAKQLGISEHQLSYITHSNSGEGLLFYGNVTIPLPGKPSAVPFPGRSHRGVPLAGSLPPGKLDGGNAGNGAAESIGWEVNSMAEKKVRKIEATVPLHRAQAFTPVKKRRVAAYARVSTDKDEQQNSYEAQVDYYTTHIQGNPEWIFAGVYSDAGITGTSMKKRDGFNQMVADALAGKIDLILTKSVSRFARNTVDSLTTVRKLKEKGVEVYFEKENIYTLDSKGELLITIMSSLAQEEARNISDNTAWGQRKRFADGKMSLGYSHFLGYKKGAADGEMEIVEEEAVIVRRIYAEFLAGKSTYDIAARLTADGIPTPAKKTTWHASTVESILHNEKYKGDAILQKRFTVDFLSKKTKKNEGEYPQYYIENNHPAIIRPEVYEMVQEEFRRRQATGGHAQCKTPFSGKIVCADCGGFYGRKVWHAGSKYAKVHWHCNNKFQKRRYCSTPTLKEESIEDCFVAAFNDLLARKTEIAENYALCLDAITDTSAYQARLDAINRECGELSTLINALLQKGSKQSGSLQEINRQYEEYVARYDVLQQEKQEVSVQIALCAAKRVQVGAFLAELEKRKTPLAKFDPLVWQATLNYMKINPNCTVTFVFRDGTEVSRPIEPGVRQYKKRRGTEEPTDGE